MKDTTLRDDDHGGIDHPCAQPICRHSRDDHRDGTGAGTNCRLCACSAYVGRSRMMGRRHVLGHDHLRQTTRGILTAAYPKHGQRAARGSHWAPPVTGQGSCQEIPSRPWRVTGRRRKRASDPKAAGAAGFRFVGPPRLLT